MHSSSVSSSSPSLKSPPFFNFSPTNLADPNPRSVHPNKPRTPNPNFRPLKSVYTPESNLRSVLPNTHNPNSLLLRSSATAGKLQCLVSEFRAMPEPIDRVRRLLSYAAVLPPIGDLGRVESNRVRGCTTQVWVEARLDSDGLMRFGADSDSEITKGFCSCLIRVLDRAAPEEVMAVTGDDLVDMNVGYSGGRAHSRVNTWHNVLMSMQKKTRDLVEEREKETSSFSPLPPPMGMTIDDIMEELTPKHRKDFAVME